MSQKSIIYLLLFIGSIIGGYIPKLWGDSIFSLSSILLSGIGGFFGIYIGYKITKKLAKARYH